MKPPPAPTWREFFISQGIAHQTDADVESIWSHHLIGREDFNKTMSKRYWSDLFDTKDSPSAKAYHFLSRIDVGPDKNSARGPSEWIFAAFVVLTVIHPFVPSARSGIVSIYDAGMFAIYLYLIVLAWGVTRIVDGERPPGMGLKLS
jgi:hypothetical protein